MKVMASVVLSLWVMVTLMAEAQQTVDPQIESRILQGCCGIITERGICRPPYTESLKRAFAAESVGTPRARQP